MSAQPRFEVVRTDAAKAWHTRIWSGSRTTFSSQNYTRKANAIKALRNHVVDLVQPLEWSIVSEGGDLFLNYTRVDGAERAVLIKQTDERKATS